MQKKILILLVLFLACQKSEAQTDSLKVKRNSLSLKIGYDNTLFKDLNFSPLKYSSNSLGYNLGYRRDFKKGSELFVNLGFSSSTPKSKASSFFDSDRYLLNIKLGYLQNITLEAKKIQVKAGLQYHTYLHLVEYEGYNSSFTYYTLHSVDIIGKLHYQLNAKHSLNTTLELPVFGLLVRPPYSGNSKFLGESSALKIATTGKWTGINDFLAINWSLGYNFLLNNNFNILASYSLAYSKTNYLEKTIIVNNQTLLGFQYKF